MVVDDNEQILLLMKTIFKAFGMRRVQLEQSANSAIDKLIKRPVDIVFCDWVMDEMDGGQFAQMVKDMELPSKVVILTGLSIEEIRKRSSGDATHGYLEKPVSAKNLLDTISSVKIG